MEETLGDFYEDDEPVEHIAAVFEAGDKFVTTPPRGRTVWLGADLRPVIPNRASGITRPAER